MSGHWKPLALLAAACVVFARTPDILTEGRFRAEDGIVYFQQAYLSEDAWETVVSPTLGYYSLVNRAAAYVSANWVPLEFAPLIPCWFAFALTLLPCLLILVSDIPGLEKPQAKLLAIALVILVPPNLETWLSLVQSQFYHGMAVALILISKTNRRPVKWLRYATLLSGGLNTPVPCFLLPFFWFDWYRTRDRDKLVESILLTGVTLVQASVVLAVAAESNRVYIPLLPLLSHALIVKQFMVPLLGWELANIYENQIRWIYRDFYWQTVWFVPALYALLLFVMYRTKAYRAGLLMAAGIFVVTVSIARAVGIYDPASKTALIDDIISGRYFILPNVLFYLSLLILSGTLQQRGRKVAGSILRAFIFYVVLCGALNYPVDRPVARDYVSGPSWRTGISRWREDPGQPVHIWPDGWSMKLPPKKTKGMD